MGNPASCFDGTLVFGDNALVSAYLEGNEDAFEILVNRYQHKLVAYVYHLVHDYEAAVDLAQEAFIRVHRSACRYEEKYQFSTWIYRIATNLAIDELRRRERKNRFLFHYVVSFVQSSGKNLLADTRRCPEKTLDRKERLQRLQVAIDSLPKRYRLAFILREVQEFSYQDTGRILGVSVGTVKSRIHRAKKLLRDKLAGLL